MKRQFLLSVLVLACFSTSPNIAQEQPDKTEPMAPATAMRESSGEVLRVDGNATKTRLKLFANSFYTLDIKSAKSAPEGADPRQIAIGKDNGLYTLSTLKPGFTTFTFSDESGKHHVVEVLIVTDTRPLTQQLKKLYPKSNIEASVVGDHLFLRGTVADQADVDKIVKMAEQFHPNTVQNLCVSPAAGAPHLPFTPETQKTDPYRPSYNATQAQPFSSVVPQQFTPPTPLPVYAPEVKRLATTPVAPAREFKTQYAPVVPKAYQPLRLPKVAYSQIPKATPWTTPQAPSAANPPTQSPVRRAANSEAPLSLPDVVQVEPSQVVMKAIVLEIDWKKLADADVDLADIMESITNAPTEWTPKKADPFAKSSRRARPFLTVAVPRSMPEGLARLLIATKAITVVSRPQLVTLSGQEAEVQVGSEIPLIARHQIRNGVQEETEVQVGQVGLNLKVMPRLLKDGNLTLEVDVAHSRLIEGKADNRAGRQVPRVRVSRHQVIVAVGSKEAVILTETGALPEGGHKKEGSGIMVIITPSIVQPSPAPAPTQTRARARTQPAPAPRLPRVVGNSAAIDKGLLFPNPAKPEQGLQNQVTQLSTEVRALRQDVKRLLEILEKDANKSSGEEQSRLAPTLDDGKAATAVSKIEAVLDRDISMITGEEGRTGMYEVRAYNIADLATHSIMLSGANENQEANIEKSLSDFARTIKERVQPASWEEQGGEGVIEPYAPNLSIVVRNVPEAHRELESLLAELRKPMDNQIVVESKVLDISDDLFERIGVDIHVTRVEGQPLPTDVLSGLDAMTFLRAAETDVRSNVRSTPKVTMFDGQKVDLRALTAVPIESLDVRPKITDDARNIKMDFHFGGPTPGDLSVKVPTGAWLLVRMGKTDGVSPENELNKIPYIQKLFKNLPAREPGHLYLMVRPKVIHVEQ